MFLFPCLFNINNSRNVSECEPVHQTPPKQKESLIKLNKVMMVSGRTLLILLGLIPTHLILWDLEIFIPIIALQHQLLTYSQCVKLAHSV